MCPLLKRLAQMATKACNVSQAAMNENKTNRKYEKLKQAVCDSQVYTESDTWSWEYAQVRSAWSCAQIMG